MSHRGWARTSPAAAAVTTFQRRQPSSRAPRPRDIGAQQPPATLPVASRLIGGRPRQGVRPMAIVTGTSGDDKYPNPEVKGTEYADQLYGLAGNDELIGFGGDDTLEGGAGADELFGSAGFDYASYKSSPANVAVNLGDFVAIGGHAQGDHLYNIEGLVGSAFGDALDGNDYRNILRGEGDLDQLNGFGGNDTLYGGGGNDFMEGGAGDDVLNGGDGSDTAVFYNFQDLAGVVVNLSDGTARGGDFLGTDRLSSIENVFGSNSNDQLVGNGGAN